MFTKIPLEELGIADDGYYIPPEGVKVSKNGAGYAKGHRGQVYPPGTFSENTTAFTSETALEVKEAGRERKRLEIRAKMEEAKGLPLEEIIGEDMVLLHEEIVENSEASPRSRIDVTKFIIEEAGLAETKQSTGSSQAVLVDGFTPELAGQLRELVLLRSSGATLELPDKS